MTKNCGASTMKNCLRATLFLQVGKNAFTRSARRQIGLCVLVMRSGDELFEASLSVALEAGGRNGWLESNQPRGSNTVDTLGVALHRAICNPSFLLLNVGFFTCGFHVA